VVDRKAFWALCRKSVLDGANLAQMFRAMVGKSGPCEGTLKAAALDLIRFIILRSHCRTISVTGAKAWL